ncbi:hypothetical protein [Deinococcus yunweiensis]|uniref:hypothetical protein n=1 Tax=Deinococcus yunweiensis TaxID=367282 RepID=UPI00398F49F3
MSDNWITIIPTEPTFVPDEAGAQSGLALLEGFAPNSENVRVIDSDRIVFIDAGANFESMRCPACRAELDIEWWDSQMEIAAAK